ncbi:hypothetical protein SERLA73DRAFT_158707 [Serpula lacrymans var. lacrymans S7.3]|uniref:Cytochrome P450 n=2 Tax=Serpula lacrymans var. lacrymans TaxID=341189 RepID=F8PN84_SERL3|nr:uncharacterized protein SERLADRAFT_413566 [Serpula lacrymans var. lacrymans S7.9]EGO03066.1 hypothetical protein SERLA73DRAFT_158707 [Serpula lacrymans var. lacrymans S7.3]EGO28831.1 hypothetical protein SERLADRAFT_413566 [Serpula lacrymans var. lacrymans S7.9]
MSSFYILTGLVAAFLGHLAYRRLRRPSFFDLIPGPPSSSILAGNLLELSTSGAGSLPLIWRQQFHENTVLRIKGPFFSGDGLFISDPTALWKVYDTNNSFARPPSMTAIGEKLVGKGGIILSEGEAHHRIKRIMQPAFNAGPVRNLLPHFRHGALALVDAWGNLADAQAESGKKDAKAAIDVFDWLGASALDMIGLAAFGMTLGAVGRMQGAESVSNLADVYKTLLDTMGAEESAVSIFIRYSPSWLIDILTLIPNKLMQAVTKSLDSANEAARALVQDRVEAIKNGDTLSNDALTLMLKANLNEDTKWRLTESEMTAQITSIFFAGHGTSAAFISWALYQLAMQPELQDRVREEILANAQQYDAEQDSNIFSSKSMPLFDAFIKEVMRFYPVVHFNEKMATSDTVLNLSRPLVLKDGSTVSEIPCPKGTVIYADIISYNFSKAIFGPNADEFVPERWYTPTQGKLAPSVYAGLFNFIAGPKACLGWRFLILESQVMLFELIRNFVFHPPQCDVLKRMQLVMVPAVMKGEELSVEMPLFVERVQG